MKSRISIITIILFSFFSHPQDSFAEPCELVLQEGQSEWASSELSETLGGRTVRYPVAHLFDGDGTTCWVEAAEGDGRGEYVAFEIMEPAHSLEIINGFAASDGLYQKNGRVRSFKVIPLLAVTAPGLVSETDARLYFAYESSEPAYIRLADTREAQLKDLPFTPEEQEVFILKSIESFLDEYPGFADHLDRAYTREYGNSGDFFLEFVQMEYTLYCLKLVIEEVYPGSRYSDTCVSEIRVFTR